jgi:parvulin-like peptidyl-prolyl cis-trans isomerase-like protein
MLDNRSLLLGTIAGVALSLIGAGIFGCQRKGGEEKAARPGGIAPQSDAELGSVLAKVDDVTITVGEFQERINRQAPYIRARYTSLEQKKEFLDSLIRFEVLAKEAYRRGFDKDPEVVRTMKQVMIQKLNRDEFETKMNPDAISEEELRGFYKQNEAEYVKPEEVRASAIVLNSRSQAEKVAIEARGEAGRTNKGFRDLVSRYSTDETTKIRGGDLRYFSQLSTEIPKPLVDAAFALARTGDVTAAIAGGDGKYYILKQTGRRKAVTKAFEDVKLQIRNRLYRDKRTEAQKSFIETLRAKAKIQVFDEALNKVRVDTSNQPVPDAHGHGLAPPQPMSPPAAGATDLTPDTVPSPGTAESP